MKIVVICLPLEFFCHKILCSFLLVLHPLTLIYTIKNITVRIIVILLYTVKSINCENSCDLLTFSILLLRNVMQFSTCSSLSHFAIHWHTYTRFQEGCGTILMCTVQIHKITVAFPTLPLIIWQRNGAVVLIEQFCTAVIHMEDWGS